jgi:hypothetical protein
MRNVCCPAYSICLDDAVKAEQPFSCDACIKRSTVAPIPHTELEASILLLWAIFRPERWRAYNELKAREGA